MQPPDFWYDLCDEYGIVLQNEWLYWQNHGWDEQVPKCRIGTAKFFTLLLLLYRTSIKSQGMKQLMAGGGIILLGTTLIPLLSGLF